MAPCCPSATSGQSLPEARPEPRRGLQASCAAEIPASPQKGPCQSTPGAGQGQVPQAGALPHSPVQKLMSLAIPGPSVPPNTLTPSTAARPRKEHLHVARGPKGLAQHQGPGNEPHPACGCGSAREAGRALQSSSCGQRWRRCSASLLPTARAIPLPRVRARPNATFPGPLWRAVRARGPGSGSVTCPTATLPWGPRRLQLTWGGSQPQTPWRTSRLPCPDSSWSGNGGLETWSGSISAAWH